MIHKRYEALGKFKEDSSKVARLPPISWGLTINDVESGEICSKNNKLDHFVDPALLFFYPDWGSWLQLISSNHLTMGNNIRILMYNYQKKYILLC